MLKIWAKTMSGDKMTRDLLYKRYERYDADKFMNSLMEICTEMDIPTPVVLSAHVSNFHQFNIVRFRQPDFVESIDFDMLILENASE